MNIPRSPMLDRRDARRLDRVAKNLMRQAMTLQVSSVAVADLLEAATLLSSELIPEDLVTMNSRVVYEEEDTRAWREVALCYPGEVDSHTNGISVLTPIGLALIGTRVGERVTVALPIGERRHFRVKKISFQPQAIGRLSV